MDAFQGILRFILNRKTVIGYSFLALLTVGGERLFSLVAFKCPCSTENVVYGLVFLFAPAWVLLILGFFLNNRSWRLFTGCCVNPRKIFPRGHSCRFFYVLGQITLSSLVAPVMWLSVALLNGTFYECAMSGTRSSRLLGLICKGKPKECWDELHKVPCSKISMTHTDYEELKLSLQAQSQILGWFLICSAAFFSLLTACYARCRSKVSYLQLSFWKTYAQTEKEYLENTLLDYAKKLSERNLKCFFENKRPEVFSMPTFAAWESASELHSFHPNQQHYSVLHRVVEDGLELRPEDDETTMVLVDASQNVQLTDHH
ncbi:calcium homeostasis modulator protein 5 [Neophocaena asiaeorientalis asiaeorientalis]|uniref:Calcium homeostasis modulator protein 5 n=2 Tax=Phocoenidae TaxID=9740 RepID=A0A341CEW6_NEOAA|nr:calcium homeostasis modulator protein 5 [Neophocaena asiaeorientalis asiaeorientalis]XP_032507681.1 calcium homeostasis modulator protein 5 [Phocoena sinus]XP_032507682.1 calcium homeostasis modulator protein 5 [Phocoena sinus]